jgi:hypothetical protein
VNPNELKRLFPNVSESVIKRNSSQVDGVPCPIVQKQQEPVQEQENRKNVYRHRSKEKEMDGIGHQQFRVSIIWLVSDRRRRDTWGMSETIADAIVTSVRRFLGIHDPRTSKRKKS